MVSRIRVYVGSSVFVFYLSVLVASSSITRSFSRSDTFILLVFAASLVVFSVLYLARFTLEQKQFARVTGEVYLCLILASVIPAFYLVWKALSSPFETEMIPSLGLSFYILRLLFLLIYHFLVNRRTVKDLNIKGITHEIEYLVVAGIGLFCLYGLMGFHDLIERGTFHLPTFEDLVLIFLVVLAEEITYRYYIQGEASEAFGRFRSVLIVSFLFAFAHSEVTFNVYLLAYRFISGFAFGYGYMRNQNLSVPIILHFLTNLFPTVFF